eukprot:3941428-Rhodomonas_salina.2
MHLSRGGRRGHRPGTLAPNARSVPDIVEHPSTVHYVSTGHSIAGATIREVSTGHCIGFSTPYASAPYAHASTRRRIQRQCRESHRLLCTILRQASTAAAHDVLGQYREELGPRTSGSGREGAWSAETRVRARVRGAAGGVRH